MHRLWRAPLRRRGVVTAMISPEREAEILRLWHAEQWKIGTIAAQLGVHHDTVRRVLAQAGQPPGLASIRPSMIDPFVPLIRQTLEKYPTLRASRLYEMVRGRGYRGSPDHFRHMVACYRPRPLAEAYLRLRTLPGEQAQVDWGHFGKLTIGRAERGLCGFVMVLSYSRQVFLRFYLGQAMPNFLRGHVAAFAAFAGVPRLWGAPHKSRYAQLLIMRRSCWIAGPGAGGGGISFS